MQGKQPARDVAAAGPASAGLAAAREVTSDINWGLE
jgi:hypothetical protein